MSAYFRLVKKSANRKTGCISIVSSGSNTCPKTCPLKGNGCYGEQWPLNLHWRNVTEGKTGVEFNELLSQIKTLPEGSILRYADVGDLPGNGTRINKKMALRLNNVVIERKLRAFCYTHYLDLKAKREDFKNNLDIIKEINSTPGGLTINISSEDLTYCYTCTKERLPSTCVVGQPIEVKGKLDIQGLWRGNKSLEIFGKQKGIVCPAAWRDTTCSECGGNKGPLCWQKDRGYVIMFPAHGTRIRKLNAVAAEI